MAEREKRHFESLFLTLLSPHFDSGDGQHGWGEISAILNITFSLFISPLIQAMASMGGREKRNFKSLFLTSLYLPIDSGDGQHG